MGCLRLNTKDKGAIIQMSDNSQPQQQSKLSGRIFEFLKNNLISVICILGTIFMTILAMIGTAYFFFHGEFSSINNRLNDFESAAANISSVNENINDINDNIETIESELEDIKTEIYYPDGIEFQIKEINNKLDDINTVLDTKPIKSSSNISPSMDEVTIENNIMPITHEIVPMSYIGVNSDGIELLAKDYADVPLLLTYKEGNLDVFFLGRYNENFQWDGFCITNVYYSDGTLYSICESNFENGKRLDYKTLYRHNPNNINEWLLTDRKCVTNADGTIGSIGTSISYKFDYDKVKIFTPENVRISDIMFIDSFTESVIPVMTKYYNGQTSNLQANDDTGQAYEIILNDDGTVKILYVGKFANGTFNDETTNAWMIAYSEENDAYYYNNNCSFTNGSADILSTTPIDQNQIDDIVENSKIIFNIELRWK